MATTGRKFNLVSETATSGTVHANDGTDHPLCKARGSEWKRTSKAFACGRCWKIKHNKPVRGPQPGAKAARKTTTPAKTTKTPTAAKPATTRKTVRNASDVTPVYATMAQSAIKALVSGNDTFVVMTLRGIAYEFVLYALNAGDGNVTGYMGMWEPDGPVKVAKERNLRTVTWKVPKNLPKDTNTQVRFQTELLEIALRTGVSDVMTDVWNEVNLT